MKVSIDSRTVEPGDYFIPVKGPNFDGKDFIQDALNKGARLLDVDLPDYAKKYRQKLGCKVIGITGSAGKTTVKEMLSSVLSQKFNVVKTKENQNNEIGVPLTLLAAEPETDVLIVEMGMRKKGDISYLTKIVRPDISIITSIGLSHLAFFKNQRGIALAKSEIFMKPLKHEAQSRQAFINQNAPYFETMKKKAEHCGYTLYPFGGEDKISENINLCYLIGHQFGLNDEQIEEGLRRYQPATNRLAVSKGEGVTLIDDSYNANPDGVKYALQFLERFDGRKIVVLGAMLELGEHSQKVHQDLVTDMIDAGVDLLFTVGEETQAMKSDVLQVMHFKDKDALNHLLLQELKVGDVVLVKGSRSLKMEETVAAVKIHLGC